MGIFCMVFGVIVFLGFAGAGALVADSLINAQFSTFATGSLADFANLPKEPLPYIVVFGFIGFLIGLSLFMKGLIYQRLRKIDIDRD